MYKQKAKPNIKAKARRGYCLEYVDNAVKAPTRRPSAKAAYEVEKQAKRVRGEALPLNVWVPVFFSLGGQYKDLGHVALARRKSSLITEIYDSEVASGQRKPYTNMAQLLAWFGNYSPMYLGWSTHCDGAQYTEETKPKPKKVYTKVRAGEGLSQIARRAGYKDWFAPTSWARIAKLNGRGNWMLFNKSLKPGQRIRVR